MVFMTISSIGVRYTLLYIHEVKLILYFFGSLYLITVSHVAKIDHKDNIRLGISLHLTVFYILIRFSPFKSTIKVVI